MEPVRPAAASQPGWRRWASRRSIGSRSKYRAMEVGRRAPRAVARPATSRSTPATTRTPPDADLVVIATPWDGAAHDGPVGRGAARGARSSSPWPTPSPGSATSSSRWCRPRGSVAASVQAALPTSLRGRRPPPRAGQGARRPRPPGRERRADLLRPPGGQRGHRRHRLQDPRHAPARRRRAVARPPRSRRSPPCCCSSTSATRPGSR